MAPGEPLGFRRVQLFCGDLLLSEADNWYVPARLTAAMNRRLATTDVPFGRVVRPLGPARRTFAVRPLWSPRPTPAEPAAGEGRAPALEIPPALFVHHALLLSRVGLPLAEVAETYLRPLLARRN